MGNLSVRITDELEKAIQEMLSDTMYSDVSDLVRDLLRKWVLTEKRLKQVAEQ